MPINPTEFKIHFKFWETETRRLYCGATVVTVCEHNRRGFRGLDILITTESLLIKFARKWGQNVFLKHLSYRAHINAVHVMRNVVYVDMQVFAKCVN